MTQAVPFNTTVFDLSSCDQEPIRIPGSIQPHGFMLTLSDELIVLQASENLARHASTGAAGGPGQALGMVIGPAAAAFVASLRRFAAAGIRHRGAAPHRSMLRPFFW